MPGIQMYTEINVKDEIDFDFSRSIDLHKISTVYTNEEAIVVRIEDLIGLKENVTWRTKHYRIYQQLSSKITAYKRPHYFVDEMQKGIFKSFKHQHLFTVEDHRTIMTDIFDYTAPLGILGKIADQIFLKKYMTRLLQKRNQVIKEFAESKRWKEVIPIE